VAPAARVSGLVMGDPIKVDVRKQPRSAVALDISIPGDVTEKVHEQVLTKLSEQLTVDGFRKGKAPREALMAKIGMGPLKLAVVEELIDVGMSKSGSQMRLQTIGEAMLVGELEDLAAVYEPGKPMSFTIKVDVYPEVPLTADMCAAFYCNVFSSQKTWSILRMAPWKKRLLHRLVLRAESSMGLGHIVGRS